MGECKWWVDGVWWMSVDGVWWVGVDGVCGVCVWMGVDVGRRDGT